MPATFATWTIRSFTRAPGRWPLPPGGAWLRGHL